MKTKYKLRLLFYAYKPRTLLDLTILDFSWFEYACKIILLDIEILGVGMTIMIQGHAVLLCGHPRKSLRQDAAGTAYCAKCENEWRIAEGEVEGKDG